MATLEIEIISNPTTSTDVARQLAQVYQLILRRLEAREAANDEEERVPAHQIDRMPCLTG